MRIAIVTMDVLENDGQGRVNFELTRHLLRLGVSVDLVADRVSPELDRSGANWIRVRPAVSSVHLLRTWDFRRRATRVIASRRGQYDVVLACGAVLDVPHTVNVVHFVHSRWIESPFHPARSTSPPERWYRKLYATLNVRWEQRSLRCADTVVAVSNLVREAVCDMGVRPDRAVVIPNGVDTDTYHPGSSHRRRFDLPASRPIALFAGDLQSPIKNLDSVFCAIQRLPDVHLAVAGSVDGSPYPAMAEHRGLSDRVHFLGFRTDMDELMRAVDFLVFPSHQDSFGLVLAEAMASGLPVITARTVGASDLVASDCGYVLDDPTNIANLTKAIASLSSDSQLRRRMGRAARAKIEPYTWTHMAQSYLDLFEMQTVRAN